MLSEGRSKRRDPFYKAIGMSPILDLAEFAAQLVGVQAAFAAMTQENPSVGGTVDVATISHRNGFEWIRHKH
jgi:predicted hotdog family 3-hydroxylacyl-ACP dehydratase